MSDSDSKQENPLLTTESDAVKFWEEINKPGQPNEALKKAKKTAEKLIIRK